MFETLYVLPSESQKGRPVLHRFGDDVDRMNVDRMNVDRMNVDRMNVVGQVEGASTDREVGDG